MEIITALTQSPVAQWATAAVAGLLGTAFGVQKLIKSWKESDVGSDIVAMLHVEVKRMGEHNNKLLTEITLLQTKVTELNTEIINLRSENALLKTQVTQLTNEVERLLEQKH